MRAQDKQSVSFVSSLSILTFLLLPHTHSHRILSCVLFVLGYG
jgi:hypothetical protein